ncbi:MAG: hypothetical protein J0I50_04330 [Microbacterium sp.]|uniref:hypothetical protein n=1 Tax=Microbacterium sp. TaxID=51671 RepID=UPI001ACC937D|nr:hypothetical protein [Microbacterium sp.]MBN9155095.1 hypothetical protein [Microbacterium sp.]MBN9171103.1 hypothetical protein [Microbacterium sp.]MBN9187834.1 hypothetical protein [Microbacterium sp.]
MTTSSPSRTWVAAGTLVIVSTLLPLVVHATASMNPIAALTVFDALLLAAALVLFAFGSPSVVARRPLGTSALLALAVWNVGAMVLWTVADPRLIESWGQVLTVIVDTVWIALALIATVSIARAGVVRRPWRLAPLWALLAVVVPQVVVYALAVSPTTTDAAVGLAPIAFTLTIAAPLFLGVLAIVLGVTPPRREASAEPIYSGRADDSV